MRCGCRISHCDPGGDGRIPEIEARVQPVVRNLHTDGTLTARVDHRFRLDHEENGLLTSTFPPCVPGEISHSIVCPGAADASSAPGTHAAQRRSAASEVRGRAAEPRRSESDERQRRPATHGHDRSAENLTRGRGLRIGCGISHCTGSGAMLWARTIPESHAKERFSLVLMFAVEFRSGYRPGDPTSSGERVAHIESSPV